MKYAALQMLSHRLKTRHSDLPLSAKLSEKLDEIAPLLKSHEAPRTLISYSPQGKASRYRNAIAVYERSNAFLADMKADVQNESKWLNPQQQQELAGVAGALSSVLNNVIIETGNYLEKNQQDA